MPNLHNPFKGMGKYSMQRPICENCNSKPKAVNYYINNKIYFRKLCEQCLKGKKPNNPSWLIAGYKPKRKCEACGFTPVYRSQVTVFYVDGNLKNVNNHNPKTVCLNCYQEVVRTGWGRGDLVPDL